MRKRSILTLCATFVAFFPGFLQAQPPETTTPDIVQLVRELGDENYHVRENAFEKLKKTGVQAASELQRAVLNPDVEISERAKELLQFVEFHWVRPTDPPQIRQSMERYAKCHTTAEKLAVISQLSDWSSAHFFRKGDAIEAICRILQFEQEQLVRAEAVRAIVAVPPTSPQFRKRWFSFVQEYFEKTEKDPLIEMTLRFAQAREKALQYREETLFEKSPEPPDAKLVEQVRKITEEFRKFRENDDYYNGRRGSDYDLLLFYALAELHEAIKLQEETDRLVAQGLDIVPIITNDTVSPYMPHFLVAKYLSERNFNLWARDEYLMAAQKDIRLKTTSLFSAAVQMEYLGEDAKALETLEQVLKLMSNPRDQANSFFNGNPEYIKCKVKYQGARVAVDRGELEEAQELLDEAIKLRVNDPHIDVLILRYQLTMKLEQEKPESELPEEEKTARAKFKEKTDEIIKQVLIQSKNQMNALRNVTEPNENDSLPYNQAAWLLANTGGDYQLTLDCAKRAAFLSSDAPNVIDTLAHAYALGKEYDKAVETQKLAVKHSPQTVIFRNVLEKFEALREEASKQKPERSEAH